jgi:hypothetical protein
MFFNLPKFLFYLIKRDTGGILDFLIYFFFYLLI